MVGGEEEEEMVGGEEEEEEPPTWKKLSTYCRTTGGGAWRGSGPPLVKAVFLLVDGPHGSGAPTWLSWKPWDWGSGGASKRSWEERGRQWSVMPSSDWRSVLWVWFVGGAW
ncbi:hypothetical protein CRUP_014210 [Coryphaenoides rupestris]|nr:hypothetical protein CRUP_014210 [Coryphaenoides rupestris]